MIFKKLGSVRKKIFFGVLRPLTNRRKTGCKAELFLKNPGKYFRGIFRRRLWGAPQSRMTLWGEDERRNE